MPGHTWTKPSMPSSCSTEGTRTTISRSALMPTAITSEEHRSGGREGGREGGMGGCARGLLGRCDRLDVT